MNYGYFQILIAGYTALKLSSISGYIKMFTFYVRLKMWNLEVSHLSPLPSLALSTGLFMMNGILSQSCTVDKVSGLTELPLIRAPV